MGITKVNSNWSKIPIKDHIYNRTDGWFKTRSISTGYDLANNTDGMYQSGGTAIMAMNEVSCRDIEIGHVLRNMSHLSWMMFAHTALQ